MKLVIISHTEHYKAPNGTIVGWGPTVNEVNFLAEDFDEIYHLAVFYETEAPMSALPYSKSNIHFVPLKSWGGPSVRDKIGVVTAVPSVVSTVRQVLKKADVFQFRAPTGIGVFLIPYLTLFVRKKGWFKYAGNWAHENPPLGYRLQRTMLKRQNRKVTINGSWTDQPAHCLTFENPCLTEDDRLEGLDIIQKKNYSEPFVFCFVGRLEDAKGVQRIIDAFTQLEDKTMVAEIHFVGSGSKIEKYKNEADTIPAFFHGALSREEVFNIYKKSHFFLLPSTASEGFPKVIAEAMNFGALPIVSSVSSIGQYINDENGFVLPKCTTTDLKRTLKNLQSFSSEKLKEKALAGYKTASLFTFKRYRERVMKEVLKD